MKQERLGILIFLFILFFILLEVRIVAISLFPDPRLKNIDAKQAKRGTIYDRNKKELAVSTAFYSFYARPVLLNIDSKNNVYDYLRQNSTISTNDLANIYQEKNFVWIRRKAGLQEITPVKDFIDYQKKNNLLTKDELGIVPEQGRYYSITAAANCIGVVGIDNNGLSGLEHSLDSYLDKGCDVYTSLDSDLLTIVYEELKRGIQISQAETGSAAILDVENREILALVNYPGFDPNDYKTITPDNLKSGFSSVIFEPGSVMKQFSAAFALEKGYATPDKPVFQCTGNAAIKDQEFNCPVAHGSVDLTKIIQKSCNIGMIQLADRFNREDFYNFLRGFGFGEAIDLPLNDIEPGILRPVSKWSFISKYWISIGQEIGVTTVQLLTASSVIAGNGIYKTPLLVKAILDDKQNNIYKPDLNERTLISPGTSISLLKMMETVVSENGTAIAAKIEGMPIAGKTGTGQIAKEGGGGYYKDLFNSVFIGYVPANKPKFTVVVVINKPKGEKHTGGQIAAPVFADIIRRMLSSTSYFSN